MYLCLPPSKANFCIYCCGHWQEWWIFYNKALKESPTTKLSTWTLVYFCFPLCICILYLYFAILILYYDIFGNCILYWKVGIFLKGIPCNKAVNLEERLLYRPQIQRQISLNENCSEIFGLWIKSTCICV